MTQKEEAIRKARELAVEYQATLVGCGHSDVIGQLTVGISVGTRSAYDDVSTGLQFTSVPDSQPASGNRAATQREFSYWQRYLIESRPRSVYGNTPFARNAFNTRFEPLARAPFSSSAVIPMQSKRLH